MSALGRSHLLVLRVRLCRQQMSQAQTVLGKPSLLRDFTQDRPLPMRVKQVPEATPILYFLLSILCDPGQKGRGGRHPGGWLGGVAWQAYDGWSIRQTHSWTLRDCGTHLHQTVHSGSLSRLSAILSLSSILPQAPLAGPSL